MAKRPQTFEATTYYKFINYEDFQPLAEWDEDKENNFLTVHLPGFKMDQINVTCIRSSRMIQLHGERKLANNKSSRFNQFFTLPQNCILENIQAKWQNEVITITMPKLHPTPPVVEQESEQTMQSDQKLKQEKVDPRQAGAVKDQENMWHEKTSRESQKILKRREQAPSPKAAIGAAGCNASPKAEKETKPQKCQEETLAQVASSTKGRSEELKKAESDVEKEKKKIFEQDDKSGDASKEKNLKEMKSVAPAAMENKEHGQTIINMGVAVLVLFAFGVFVSSSLGSKSK